MEVNLKHYSHLLIRSSKALLERLRLSIFRVLRSSRFIRTFADAIDWKEPWLLLLGICYSILLLIAISTRKSNIVQMGIFIFTLLGVYFAERLNLLLSHNWTMFAQYPYFDHDGIFMSAVWSAPLLFIACIIVANSMMTLIATTVRWKGAEKTYQKELAACKEE